jgi:hypothetical protein
MTATATHTPSPSPTETPTQTSTPTSSPTASPSVEPITVLGPLDTCVAPGQTVSFSVTTTGNVLAYVWQRFRVGAIDWEYYNRGSTLTETAVETLEPWDFTSLIDGDEIRVVAYDLFWNGTQSDIAILRVSKDCSLLTPTATPTPTVTPTVEACNNYVSAKPSASFSYGPLGNTQFATKDMSAMNFSGLPAPQQSCMSNLVTTLWNSYGGMGDVDSDDKTVEDLMERSGQYYHHALTTFDIYFDQNCNVYNNCSYTESVDAFGRSIFTNSCTPPAGRPCGSFTLDYFISPISLRWDTSKGEQPLSYTQFALDPHKEGWWYLWRGSAETPVLVYDPKQSGKIDSGVQLFGSWTFGGKGGTASAPAKTGADPWKNGYEALSTLDADSDGKLTKTELDPLALWFDADRDGIADKGEVRSVHAAGVTSLFVTPDEEQTSKYDVIASRGFERTVDGKTVLGSSFDWFVEGASSKTELIQKRVLHNSEPANNPSGKASVEVPSPTETREGVAVNSPLNGAWSWTADDVRLESKDQVGIPNGILTFRVDSTGELSGFSFAEVSTNVPNVRSQMKVARLSGKLSTPGDARQKFSFILKPGERSTLESQAQLSADGSTIHGTTTAIMPIDGKESTLTYSWTASRVGEKRKEQ